MKQKGGGRAEEESVLATRKDWTKLSLLTFLTAAAQSSSSVSGTSTAPALGVG